jgi:amino acid transporter
VAAYEAQSRLDIGWPTLWTHWIVFFLYFFMALGAALTVSWNNRSLPPIFGGSPSVQPRGNDTAYPVDSNPPNTTSAAILALHAFSPGLAGVVNGFFIFSVVSAANTALYYSSRTLWGLTHNLKDDQGFSKWFGKLSVLMDNGAPGRAVIISVVTFCWLPFLQLGRSLSIDHVGVPRSRFNEPANRLGTWQVLEVLSISSSMSCLLVWLALLIAFLRFKAWYVHRPGYSSPHAAALTAWASQDNTLRGE